MQAPPLMAVRVNGATRHIASGTRGAELLALLGQADAPLVVEVNGVVINKAHFETSEVFANDEIELVTIVGGG
jgi:sulfur carrier protein